MSRVHWSSVLIACAWACGAVAQPCLIGYTLTASTPPANGTYACGETVTFCLTIDSWNTTNANWFHGVVASFGPGWDLATLTPGTPPAPCGTGGGTWGWYNSVQGTAGTSIGAQGPGFFYDLNNDGTPGNNFGDFCTGPWTFCWTISVLSGPACVNGLDLGVSVNTFGDSETGSWGSTGCTGDVIVPSTPAVIQSCAANAGTGGALALCNTSPPIDLFAALTGGPDAGGTWSDPNGNAMNGLLDPMVGGSGNYTYTVGTLVPPCSSSSVFTVSIAQQPDAGTSGTLTACSSEPAVALNGILGGTPDAGGTWSGPSGVASGTFTPATDPAGTYTYMLAATAPCVSASADVVVAVNASPNAGASGSLTLCSNSTPAPLINALGGAPSAGGTWTGPNGAALGGTYDPVSYSAGVYTYTVLGVAPCPNSTATVNVTENVLPNAGASTTVYLCSSAAPASFISLLAGTPDPGGSWSGPGGVPVGPTLDPATASVGDYTYTVAGAAPCPNASALLTVDISVQPDAGSIATLNLCEASAPTDLFAELGGTPDANGAWTAPSGAPFIGVLDPANDAPGIYTYSVPATTYCSGDQSTVTVTISPQPNAGVDATLALCSNDASTALLPLLGATALPGGTWTDPNGTPTSGSFTPLVNADGIYTYTILAAPPCVSSSATITVTTTTAGSAGVGTPLTLCETGPIVALDGSLSGTPDLGGIWTGPGGGPSDGTLDPANDAAGAYTYTLPANGPCAAESTVVDVTIHAAPDAGSNGVVALCSSAPAYALVNALGGTPAPNGTWTDPFTLPHGNSLSPATDAAGDYTYTVPGTAPCTSASSTVTVTIATAANAGTGGTLSLCASNAPVDPFTSLNGAPDPGGNWTAPDGSSITALDASTATSGSYTYTIGAVAPCPSAQAILNVTIDPLPNAGTNNAIDLCADAAVTNLLLLLGSAQLGGSWVGPAGAANNLFDPAVNIPGTYLYTVAGSGACANEQDQASVDVSVLPLPQPSFTVSDSIGCVPLNVQLVNTSSTAVQSTTWTFGDGSTSADADSTWHSYSLAGSYHITLEVQDASGCTGSTTVSNAVNASDGPSPMFYALPLRVSVSTPTTWITQVPEPGVSYQWTIDTITSDTSGTFPWTFDPAFIGQHPICLTASDTMGCVNTYCIDVVVDDDLTIFVANAFTPNGDDHNDVFRPSILGVQADWYEFMVFDRWGLLVFRTSDPNEAWNGGMSNAGDVLPNDVYVWTLKAKDQFTPEKQELIGTVTLVK